MGETWLHWVNTHTRTTKTSIVPEEVRSRNDLINIDAFGQYTINAALANARDGAPQQGATPEAAAAHRARGPPAAAPQAGGSDYFNSPMYWRLRSAYTARHGDRWWQTDHLFQSYEAECRSMDTAAAPGRAPRVPPRPARAATPRPDPNRDHLVAERNEVRPPERLGRDPHRDMSGDAVTYMSAEQGPDRAVSEYALSAARNLARDESLTRESFEEHYVGGGDLTTPVTTE